MRPRVGLFITGGAYAYQMDIISGAHAECERRGLDLLCFAGGSLGWPDPRSHAYRVASPADLDAAILVPGTWGAPLDSAEVRELLEPYLALPACIVGARVADVPSVCIDNEGGMAQLTRHLIEVHGCQRIAFIAGAGPESVQRQRGYEAALRSAGIEPDPELHYPGDFTPESGREAAAQWLRGGALPCDAIIAANDWMALGALEVLQDAGVRVPEDVALVGFDDIDRAKFIAPPLTTIRQPPHLLAVEAVSIVDDLAKGELQRRHVAVATIPQIRRSCGCYGHAPMVRRSVPPAAAPTPSLAESRGRIAARLTAQAAPLATGLAPSWPEELLDALEQDLRAGSEHVFLDCLGQLISRTEQQGHITVWHHVISRLREEAIPCLLHDLNVSTRAEVLFGRAYIDIGQRAELTQARLLVEREDLLLRLESASREARTALDWPALCRVLTEHLPGFRISRFYVASHQGMAPGESVQVYAYADGRELALPEGGIRFRTSQVVAPEVRPEQRTSLVVQALFMREEILGFCCLEIGRQNGSVLKTLSELISSSLKATQLSEALVEEVTRRERAERARMHQELEIAARIQTAILPRQPRVPGLELATAMRPASEVGGDYFDILPGNDGCWIGIGDVAGHGLPAGLVMLMIQSIVAATVHGRRELRPAQAWRSLNTVLSDNIRQRLGLDEHATLCLIRYHESGRLCFSGAHEDLVIYRKATGRVECVRTPGIWAGILADVPESEIEEQYCELEPGDVLVLYTDGVVEAMSRAGEMYGIDRLKALLAECGQLEVDAICARIVEDVSAWMETQADDITLIVARQTQSVSAEAAQRP